MSGVTGQSNSITDIELRAWAVFVVRDRNWKLWAYWLKTQARNMT